MLTTKGQSRAVASEIINAHLVYNNDIPKIRDNPLYSWVPTKSDAP